VPTTDDSELGRIMERVDRAAAALAAANQEVRRCRESERSAHLVLDSILETVPCPVAVVDDRLRIRAASASAEKAGVGRVGAEVAKGALSAHVGRLRELVRASTAQEADVGDGWCIAPIDEVADGERCWVLWHDAEEHPDDGAPRREEVLG
jgi:hypothetical protein